MKRNHNLKVGEKLEFDNLGEVQNWAENNNYKEDEFECISVDPFVYRKVR